MANMAHITEPVPTKEHTRSNASGAFDDIIDQLAEAFRIEALLEDPFDPAMSAIAHDAAATWADVEMRAYEILRGCDPIRATAALALLELLEHDGTSPETIMQPVGRVQQLLSSAPARSVCDLPLRRQLATLSQFMVLIAAQALDTHRNNALEPVNVCA
ncbi:hypothetical protein [Salipiger bermudensis]|uniref:hypothetical protein n=1 Tax=Salipiger bermudensis TaxID=344736 RepID=UPI003008259B